MTRLIWTTGVLATLLTLFLGTLSFAARTLEDRIADELLRGLPWDASDVEVTDLEVAGYDLSRDKFDDVIVSIPKGMRGAGKVTFSVILVKAGKETKRIWASARIRVLARAVIALNPLTKGRLVGPEDVRVARVNKDDSQNAASSLDEVVGNIALRPVPAGSVVKRDYMRRPFLVKKGETVTLTAENDRIRIRSKGVAVEDGSRGSLVNVRTISGRLVAGKVTGLAQLTLGF